MEDLNTQREKDKAFLSWCIDQYLEGKVDADGLVRTITMLIKPAATPYADNFIPVLRPGYPVIFEHTEKTPFCPDRACPCKKNREAIANVNQLYQEGLITAEEATEIVQGQRAW